MFSPERYCVREHYAVATIYLLHATSYLQRVMPQSKPNTHTIFINNIQGTGLETCHVSASNACKTKHLSGVRTLLSLHIIYCILYLKDRSVSCGTILEKPWGL